MSINRYKIRDWWWNVKRSFRLYIFNPVYYFFFPPTEVISLVGKDQKYANLTEWSNARQGNLCERNTIEVAEIVGGIEVKQTIEYWKFHTDALHYIIVRGSESER